MAQGYTNSALASYKPKDFIGARFFLDGHQLNIVKNTTTNVDFNGVDYDIGSNFTSGANSYYTIPEDGYYHIGLNLRWSNVVDQQRYYCVISNGDYEGASSDVALGINTPSGTENMTVACNDVNYWSAGDKVYFGVYQTSAVDTPDVYSANQNSYGFVHLISKPYTAVNDFIGARAYLAVQQSNITHDTTTKILLDTEDYDVGSNYDLANSKFVTPYAGYYQITGQAEFGTWDPNWTLLIIYIYADGAAIGEYDCINGQDTSGYQISVASNVTKYLDAGVDIDIRGAAYPTDNRDSVDIKTGIARTYMEVRLLSRTA